MIDEIIQIANLIELNKSKKEQKQSKKEKTPHSTDDIGWKPTTIDSYTVPLFVLPNRQDQWYLEKLRKKLSKVLAFIHLTEYKRVKDGCTIMPIPSTNKELIGICGNHREVSRLIEFMCKIGLISICDDTYKFNRDDAEQKIYYYYYENEVRIKEYCSQNGITIYVPTNVHPTKTRDIAMPFNNDDVRFTSKISLRKPDGISASKFEQLLTSILYKNYPFLTEYQQLADSINTTYYSNYPQFQIRFSPNFTWDTKNKRVVKIGIRATNQLVSATAEESHEKRKISRNMVRGQYGLNLEYDVKSSVPRLTYSINYGEWISEDVDLYHNIFLLLLNNETDNYYQDEDFYRVRESIKSLCLAAYFDFANTIGRNTCYKIGIKDEYVIKNRDAITSIMKQFQSAVIEAVGGKVYDSEIFLAESCIYMDVLSELLKNGYMVWQVYDGFYARKDGASQLEFQQHMRQLVADKANEFISKWGQVL